MSDTADAKSEPEPGDAAAGTAVASAKADSGGKTGHPAPTSPPIKGEGTYESVSSIRQAWQHEMPGAPAPLVLQQFIKRLEAFVWDLAQVNNQRRVDSDMRADTGFDKVYVDTSAKDTRLHYLGPGSTLVLNFAGRITMVPTVGAVHVCSAWKLDFYVTAGGLTNVNKECFVPAWMVPGAQPPKTTKKASSSSSAASASAIMLDVRVDDVKFEFVYHQGGKKLTETVPVKIVSLRLPPDAAKKKDAYNLTRPARFQGLVTKDDIEKKEKTVASKKDDRPSHLVH